MQGLGKGGDREANLAKCRAGAQPKVTCLRGGGAQRRQWQGQCRHRTLQERQAEGRGGGSRQCAAGRLRRAAAHHRRYHRRSRQREARPGDAGKVEGRCRRRAGKDIASDLADFYYDRGNARALLGRNVEALADGEKALAAATASGDGYFGQRIRQFISIQKMALGDIKGALQIAQFMITDANRPGQKGYLFNALRMAAYILVQMGDIPQAEGYLRRSIALLQEARTSGLPGWRTNYRIKGRSLGRRSRIHSRHRLRGAGPIPGGGGGLRKRRASGSWRRFPTCDLPHAPPRIADAWGAGRRPSQRRAHEGEAGPARGSRGRCAERVAIAAEGPGQIQSANHAGMLKDLRIS